MIASLLAIFPESIIAGGTALYGIAASIFLSITGFVATAISFFGAWFTWRLARFFGILSVVVGLALGFYSAGMLIISSIAIVVPSYIPHAVSLVVPSNLWPCFSLIISLRVMRWVYMWRYFLLRQIQEGNF